MAASETILADLQTAASATPNAASAALAIAAAGPIQDIKGRLNAALLSAQELRNSLTELDTVVHSSDTTIKNVIADVLDALN
jgi:hypothetical protein